MSRPDKDLLVYSSEAGRMCRECQYPVNECRCGDLKASAILGNGKITVKKDSKNRNGKVVTVVYGLPHTAADLKKLLVELKKRCGSGGAVKEGTVEIQGDHAETITKELLKRGYTI